MTEDELRSSVPGSASFIDWFGYWPMFHDAEVVSCELQRAAASRVVVHTFEMTKEIDANGFYVLDKHALVTFLLSGLQAVEVADFNDQNALWALALTKVEDQFVLTFDPSHGLSGKLAAKQLHIEWVRGKPAEGVYS